MVTQSAGQATSREPRDGNSRLCRRPSLGQTGLRKIVLRACAHLGSSSRCGPARNRSGPGGCVIWSRRGICRRFKPANRSFGLLCIWSGVGIRRGAVRCRRRVRPSASDKVVGRSCGFHCSLLRGCCRNCLARGSAALPFAANQLGDLALLEAGGHRVLAPDLSGHRRKRNAGGICPESDAPHLTPSRKRVWWIHLNTPERFLSSR
jgi:hypothetical protein